MMGQKLVLLTLNYREVLTTSPNYTDLSSPYSNGWHVMYNTVPNGEGKVDGVEHGEAGNGDHAHEHVREEPQMRIIKQSECSEKYVPMTRMTQSRQYLMMRVKRAVMIKTLSKMASAMSSLWKVSRKSFLFIISTVTVLPEGMMM